MTSAERYLLDTNVISEAIKPRPAPGVVNFLKSTPLTHLHLSSISIGEIEWGIEIVPDAGKRAALRQWLTHSLHPDYAGRILSINEEVMVTWARMVVSSGQKPKQLPCMDALIAATALHHHLTIVTRNNNDFTRFGVNVLNP